MKKTYSVGFYYKAWVQVEAENEQEALELAREVDIDPSKIEYYEMDPDVVLEVD